MYNKQVNYCQGEEEDIRMVDHLEVMEMEIVVEIVVEEDTNKR